MVCQIIFSVIIQERCLQTKEKENDSALTKK